MKFTKMQGLGNDFIIINNLDNNIKLTKQQIKQLADRNFGIGFDQLLVVAKSTNNAADFDYIIYNADGSEVEQCGNGARCFARFVYEKGITTKKNIKAKTTNKLLDLTINSDDTVTVNMGSANFSPKNIANIKQQQDFYHIAGKEMGLVDMGNPHCILIVNDITINITPISKTIQNSKEFINGVNVNFVKIIDDDNIELRVFERGVGETLACGSGACATVAFLHKIGKLQSRVNVSLPGGIAIIDVADDIYLSGPAEFVFEGEIPNI